ncbi:DNA cytosine methyltransferase [Mycoplasmopsis felis]|uniref:DNA cytosine methyltransferase n=1 Tax=Mycoplasmopsis felis TaxID=33923 RepID=UPI0028BEA39C|nr:DNA cytosine methyltransferase [Mycoplasmopsis felis]
MTYCKRKSYGVHIHPELHRVLTPRELARLQSFPDEFIFLGTKSNILKQIGNAVPPKLSEVIAKMIKEIFF